MINANYLKYLFKSKRFLIAFVFLISLLLGVNSLITGNRIGDSAPSAIIVTIALIALGIMLCFIMPCITFSYIHDKKAVDTYLSLPVSRKTMLFTGVLFNCIVIFVPLTLGMLIALLATKITFSSLLAVIFAFLLAVIAISSVNTLVYFSANSVVDGLIMMAAYTVLPLALYLALMAFMGSYVAGFTFGSYDFIGYLSPSYVSAMLFVNILDHYKDVFTFTGENILYTVILLVMIAVALFAMYKSFVNRKAERAGTISTGFFAYRLIIYLYTFLCVFMIATMYTYGYSLLEFFENYFFLYLLVFALFVIAHFVYKRKFYLNFKLPAYFIAVIVVCLLFTSLARATKGFGLSYSYPRNDSSAIYHMYQNFDGSSNEVRNDEIARWFYSQESATGEMNNYDINGDYYYFTLQIDSNNIVNNFARRPNLQSTTDIMDRLRGEMIDAFYAKDHESSPRETYFYTRLEIYNGVKGKGDYETSYSYNSTYVKLSLNDILTLAKDPNVSVHISSYYEYYVTAGGKLVKE